jgi:hypothetical protein
LISNECLYNIVFVNNLSPYLKNSGSATDGDNPSTHPDFDPDLWMEVGSSGGPDKIRCMGSPTLQPRTCGHLVVSQPLGAPNQYRAPNLRSSWPCSNTQLSSPKNTSNYWRLMNNTRLISPRNTSNSQRIMNSFTKWS